MSNKLSLLIVDMQNDFCDPIGSMYVPEAENDVSRTCQLLEESGNDITNIYFTMDSHHSYDISHPYFWVSKEGTHPDSFTIITPDDIRKEKFLPVDPKYREYAKYYVETLEEKGNYPLCIWPLHCLIGSWGHSIPNKLSEKLSQWEIDSKKTINYIQKGENPLTEHYSAIEAEVPDPNDLSTHTNLSLVSQIESSDKVLVVGEASSHCVAATTLDLINYMVDYKSAQKLHILTDTMHSVPNFEDMETEFYSKVKDLGAVLTTTKDLQSSIT